MSELLLFARGRNGLQHEEVTNVPNDHFVGLIHSEDERSFFQAANITDRLSVTFQLSQESVSEEVFRAPNIDVAFETERDELSSEFWHVTKLSNSCYMSFVKPSQHFLLLQVVHHYCAVK